MFTIISTIATCAVMGFGFITLISSSTNIPIIVVSEEALFDDNDFTIENEYGYVLKAIDENGDEMSFEEIRNLKNDTRMDLEFIPKPRK